MQEYLIAKQTVEHILGIERHKRVEEKKQQKKNSAEGRERATVHSVLECETVATFCILLRYNMLIITYRK